MKTKVLFCGSFHPFHIGHLNILKKAEKMFGKENIIVCIGKNPSKIYDVSFSSSPETLSEKLGVEVIEYHKYLHKLVEDYESLGYNVVVVRGLRDGKDLDFEMNQEQWIKEFKKDVSIVYITCDREFTHISSSAIREVAKFGSYQDILKFIPK